MKRSVCISFVLLLVLLLASVQLALAHAKLDRCTPAVNSSVAQAPAEVRCTFTEKVDVAQSALAVYDANNNQVDNKDMKADPADRDGKTLVVTLNRAKMSNGIYTVKWTSVDAEDGARLDGQWQFGVGVPVVLPKSGVEHSMNWPFALMLAFGGLLLLSMSRRLRRHA